VVNAGKTKRKETGARSLLFGLVDNVQVSAVPEPASLLLAGLAAPALWRLRRK